MFKSFSNCSFWDSLGSFLLQFLQLWDSCKNSFWKSSMNFFRRILAWITSMSYPMRISDPQRLNDSTTKQENLHKYHTHFSLTCKQIKTIDIRSILSNLVHDFYNSRWDVKRKVRTANNVKHVLKQKSNFETKHIVFNAKQRKPMVKYNVRI